MQPWELKMQVGEGPGVCESLVFYSDWTTDLLLKILKSH